MKRSFSIKIGKGVLGKDKQPFAPGTIMYKGNKPVNDSYSVEGLLDLLLEAQEITVIDRNNRKVTLIAVT